ncbi:MAG: peptide deformylase [Tannerella sp.]|jgi:peptide deformylase|nr:peptide deformylase [Tannerella sp.]
MILPIFTYGQPVLRNETTQIDSDYPGLKQFIDDMFETMYNADGVGLAAPQVGRSIRMFVIDANALAKDHPECKDFKRIMINPEILERSDNEVTYEEGCLSFPGIHEKVTRSFSIKVRYEDGDRNQIEEILEGFPARVIQHEYDHLEGQVFIDIISPIRKHLNKSKLNNIIKGTVKCDYRIKTLK